MPAALQLDSGPARAYERASEGLPGAARGLRAPGRACGCGRLRVRAGRDSPPPARVGAGCAPCAGGECGQGRWAGAEASESTPRLHSPGWVAGVALGPAPSAARPLQGHPGPGGSAGRRGGRCRLLLRPSPGAPLGWNRDQPSPGALASATFSCPTGSSWQIL